MGTVHDKIVDTLEVGYILEDKTIRTPPVFPILTSPPPHQTKPAAVLFRTGKWSKGGGKACLRA